MPVCQFFFLKRIFVFPIHQAPVAATSLNPNLPAKLERIIDRALEKDRNLRYQSAKDLGTHLGEVARALAPAEKATAQSETTEQRRAAGRRRTLSWRVEAVVALLAVIISGGMYWRWRTHKPAALTDKDTIVLADFDNKRTTFCSQRANWRKRRKLTNHGNRAIRVTVCRMPTWDSFTGR